MKDSKVVLRQYTSPVGPQQYGVVKTVNTLDPKPGEKLDENAVQKLIRRVRTTVEITAK